ncbi:MAG: hypothetical protein CSA65_08225 [Proteobacteria bacterium]|nr:MAG: hypothetical protein CSA65_08225 [Pseudomonadota bacterium]
MYRRHKTSAIASALALLFAGCFAGDDPLFADGGGGDGLTLPDAVSCLPNNDGVIDLNEVAFLPGLALTYRTNKPGTTVAVDVAGKTVNDALEWDFSARDGVTFTTALEEVKSQWWAPIFPNASHAVPSDPSGKTLQVVQVDGDRLLLLGLVSRDKDVTRLVYDTPVLFLRFPLKVGDSYSTTAQALDGKLDGLPIATEDTYTVTIDALGTVRLPFVKLSKTLRIRVDVETKAVGGVKNSVKQVQWFHECYGEIARVVSKTGETQADFTQATEFRRLSF